MHIKLPVEPGCHGFDTYVAFLANEISYTPNNNRIADQICKAVYSSNKCCLLGELPVCTTCEAQWNYWRGRKRSVHCTSQATTAMDHQIMERQVYMYNSFIWIAGQKVSFHETIKEAQSTFQKHCHIHEIWCCSGAPGSWSLPEYVPRLRGDWELIICKSLSSSSTKRRSYWV